MTTGTGTDRSFPTDPEHRRRPVALVMLLVGAACGSIISLVLVAATRDNESGANAMPDMSGSTSSASSGSSAAASLAAMSSELKNALTMHMPPDLVGSCALRDTNHAAGYAFVSVVCHEPIPGTTKKIAVQYSSIHDGNAIVQMWATDMQKHGITSDQAHPCSETAATETASPWWSVVTKDAAGPVFHRLTNLKGTTTNKGFVLCYGSGDSAYLEWTDSDTHIFAWASVPQQYWPQMFDWWRSCAGPEQPLMGSVMTMSPSPSSSPMACMPASGPDPSVAPGM